MKFLRDFFDKLEPKFAKGGPLHRWFPLFEATDSFLFHSRRTTQIAPHVRDGVDYKRIMITVIIALIPCVIMALWNTGYQANLALQPRAGVAPGWRGAVMALVGCDPASLVANMVHGALYFLPIYLVTVVVGSSGKDSSTWCAATSFPRPSWSPASFSPDPAANHPLWQVALGASVSASSLPRKSLAGSAAIS
jgi:Na+-transporting NADH:ubiquinone oxidoreductase subunit B